ncbi:MAG: EamA family transporter, partial [Chloroflexota bacterium]
MNKIAAAAARDRATALGIWAGLSAIYLIWGSTYLAIRFTVETMPPFLSAAARFLASGAFLYLWRRAAGDPAPTAVEWRNASIIGVLLLVGGNGGVVWAAQYIPSSLSALLVATVPLWMVLFDTVRRGGEGPGSNALGGLLIGFCGAAILIGWTAADATPRSFSGALAVVGASFLWAIGSIYGKTSKLPSSPLVTTGIEMLVGGAVQVIVSFLFGEFARIDFASVSPRSALAWAYLTAIGPIAFVAYAWLLRVAPI